MEKMNEISQQVGYVLVCNNNDIIPVSDIQNTDLQKVVIFEDSVCEKNQKPLIDYFIQGHHKKLFSYLPITELLCNTKTYKIELFTFRIIRFSK